MASSSTVVPLFISEADLEASYRVYDTAMRRLAALHQDPDSVYEDRWAAARDAMEAERDFRSAFARAGAGRWAAGA